MGKDRVVSSVLMRPQTESNVFEWEAVDYLRERLFCDFCGEHIRHGSRKDALMICIEDVAHATCVNVLGGRHSRPSRVVVHFDFALEILFVVVLRMRHQVDRIWVERDELRWWT